MGTTSFRKNRLTIANCKLHQKSPTLEGTSMYFISAYQPNNFQPTSHKNYPNSLLPTSFKIKCVLSSRDYRSHDSWNLIYSGFLPHRQCYSVLFPNSFLPFFNRFLATMLSINFNPLILLDRLPRDTNTNRSDH